jgi:hypothetical protein
MFYTLLAMLGQVNKKKLANWQNRGTRCVEQLNMSDATFSHRDMGNLPAVLEKMYNPLHDFRPLQENPCTEA